MFEFVYPNWFWALLLIPLFLVYELLVRRHHRIYFSHSRLNLLRKAAGHNSLLKYLPLLLRSLTWIMLIIALARPRLAFKEQEVTGQGIDIIISLDISPSMKAIDFQPVNRLEAAKAVAARFIENRRNDRIGLIVFSDNAYTQCPLTLDYNILMNLLTQIDFNENSRATAIGMGLATSVARLKESEAKSKVIILITDGKNNTGEIDPLTASELAATFGIKVYPIGVGSKDEADFPVQTPYGIRYQKIRSEIDMEMLDQIARITGTEKASRAQNTKQLEAILEYIDSLEKAELKIKNYFRYQDLFQRYLLWGLFFLVLELVIRLYLRFEQP
ncbi:MAG: VWA domain-containing protein [Candidatus Cloacimonetes bacterium]|nr:VWA domain-containing protein [Candidatus Cloacimonadota bacterium]